jgi:serine phosphatase RsbU (regulator of sigma subunit)
MDDPALAIWMQDSVPPSTAYEERPGRWVGTETWPSPDVTGKRHVLGHHRIAPPGEEVAAEKLTVQSPLSVGQFAGKWCSYNAPPDLPYDQREDDGGSLVFDSPVLDERLELLGAPVVHLEFSADRPMAMVAVRLSDVAPDGKAPRVSYGLANLTHRTEPPSPLEPGKRHAVDVALNGMAQSFPAGHRLRISISTSYWPLAWPPPEPVMLTVFAGVSTVTLPVRRATVADDASVRFGEPESTPPIPVTQRRPGEQRWTVTRDLARDASTLEVVKNLGVITVDDVDMSGGRGGLSQPALPGFRIGRLLYLSTRGHPVAATSGDHSGGAERLEVVRRYLSLNTGPDAALDRICRLAARIFDAPMAVVSFVGDEQVWFKGRYGLDLTEMDAMPGLCATAAFRTGTYVLIDAAADPNASRHPMVTGEPGVRFYAAAPVSTAGGHRLGTVGVMDTEPRRATARELAMLHDLAALITDDLELRRAAVSVIEVEQEARSRLLAEAERVGHIAHTLHGSLMPSHLPKIPDLDVAVFYQPFSSDELGGDFYDVFPLGERRWGIFAGDVVGKGVEAAAYTSLARYSLRAAAFAEDGPGEALGAVNEAVLLDPGSSESIYCTIAYGEFTPTDGKDWRVTLAIGGHPPPLVLRNGGRVDVVHTEGTIIGAFGSQRYLAVSVELAPGDTILFYSDGMTELPQEGGGWLGIEGVVDALEERSVATAVDAIEVLRGVMTGTGESLRDDVVIVAVTVPREPLPEGSVTVIDTTSRAGSR